MATHVRNLSTYSNLSGFLGCFDVLDTYHERRRAWGSQQGMMSVFALCEPGSARSYADGCQQMFAWVGERFGLTKVPAQSGLTRARSRVTDGELARVWDMARSWTEAQRAQVVRAIPGRRLIGIDGTTLIMPRSASTSAAYGIRRHKDGRELSHYPEALMTSAWDLETRMPLCWRLQQYFDAARKSLATRRKRKSRPREAFHPYAKPRRNHGK